MIERHLSPEALSELVPLSPTTIRQYCRDGTIKASRMGKNWMIPESQVIEALKRAEHKPTEPGVAEPRPAGVRRPLKPRHLRAA